MTKSPVFSGLEKQLTSEVRGKNILVTSGSCREVLDGVRHYANDLRSEDQGHRVAAALVSMGATVTLVTAKTNVVVPEGVGDVVSTTTEGRAIVSADDLAEACTALCASRTFDVIVSMASVPSLKPAVRAENKLKVKTSPGEAVVLDVRANRDVMEVLRSVGGAAAMVGYNARQEFVAEGVSFPLWKAFADCFPSQRVVIGTARRPQPCAVQDLVGKKIILTSGPVAETLTTTGDVITNFSSGRQGHAIACALADRGAEVVLIAGPVTLPDPVHANIRTLHVRSARDMLEACEGALPADAYIGVAAVADFSVAEPMALAFDGDEAMPIELIQNPDILMTCGKHPTMRPDIVIGFAAETKDLQTYARAKLEKKGADAIFANLVGDAIVGRGSERNHVFRVTAEGVVDCGETDKYAVGTLIADTMVGLFANMPSRQRPNVTTEAGPTQS